MRFRGRHFLHDQITSLIRGQSGSDLKIAQNGKLQIDFKTLSSGAWRQIYVPFGPKNITDNAIQAESVQVYV